MVVECGVFVWCVCVMWWDVWCVLRCGVVSVVLWCGCVVKCSCVMWCGVV